MIQKYIDVVEELKKRGYSEDVIIAILKEVGLDDRTEFIAEQKKELDSKPSQKQKDFLVSLGYKEEIDKLTREQASKEIEKLLNDEKSSFY